MSQRKKKFTLSEHTRRQRKPSQPSARVQTLENYEDKPPFYIRGIKAGSKEEYWVSLALVRIEEMTGWSWEYQVPVFGGRDRRGGNVVDFLVHTPGRYTMLQPEGRYWHTGHKEDAYQMQNVARKKNWNLIVWYTDEYPTRDAVYSFLKRELHVV